MDIRELAEWAHEPEEIYLAAFGEPEKLAVLLESDAELKPADRRALAAFLRGELVPPKRGRGRRTLSYLAEGTLEQLTKQRIKNSVVLLRHIMRHLRERREHYGRFEKAVDYVAEFDNLTHDEVERVRNKYRRAKSDAEDNDEENVSYDVIQYHKWLHRTGRLPNFPQPISTWEEYQIVLSWKHKDLLQELMDEKSKED